MAKRKTPAKRTAKKTTVKKKAATRKKPAKKKAAPKPKQPDAKNALPPDPFESFVNRIECGRELLLACREAEADPRQVIDRIRTDEAYQQRVNTAKKIAYQRVQAALYDAAASGTVAAIKEWNTIQGAAQDSAVEAEFDKARRPDSGVRESDVETPAT